MSNTKLHSKLLSLVGKTINITRWSNAQPASGQLIYVAPDSILVSTGKDNLLVDFSDLKTFNAQE